MQIGIDVTASIYTGGVATYYRNLVPQLLQQGRQHNFVLLGYACRLFSQLDLANRRFFLPPRLMELVWNQLHVVPVERLSGPVDVFHAWDYLQPPTRHAKIVTTIHDLTTMKFPLFHHRSTVDAQAHRLRWVRREADAVIADSQATKQDIIELLGIDENKIHVIYLAAGEAFGEFNDQSSEFKADKINQAKKKYDIDGEYLLSVGTMEPRKNLKRVVEAFSLVSRQSSDISQLIIAGQTGWGEELKPAHGVKTIGRVTDADLPALYAGAQALVFPSLYEGFGLPVLEAMTVGCPVVTSDRGSLKEVAGTAAALVDPEHVGSIAGGIEEVISKRNSYVSRGYKQAGKFSWQKAAQETLQVYEAAAG